MKKNLGIIIAVGAVVALGIFLMRAPAPDESGSTGELAAVNETDWIKGATSSAVVLIEYSDFQCPACQAYFPALKQLAEEFGDQITFVYRHFPLRQIHFNAEAAARAAEAAGRQGKFWEMHDKLFENQTAWANDSDAFSLFSAYAESLGLDPAKFEADFNSQEVADKVENDYRSGIQAGVNSTPTFFINGSRISNPRSIDQFRSILERELAQ